MHVVPYFTLYYGSEAYRAVGAIYRARGAAAVMLALPSLVSHRFKKLHLGPLFEPQDKANLSNTHMPSPSRYSTNTHHALMGVRIQPFTYLILFLFAREAPGFRNVTSNGKTSCLTA
jgi:hypothetical protein